MPVPRCPECGRVLRTNNECENGCVPKRSAQKKKNNNSKAS